MTEERRFAPEGPAVSSGNGRADVACNPIDLIEQRLARIEQSLALRLPAAARDAPCAPILARRPGSMPPAPKREFLALERQLSDIAARLDGVVAALDGTRLMREGLIEAGERQMAQIAQLNDVLAQTRAELSTGLRNGEIIVSKIDSLRGSLPIPLSKRAARTFLRRWPGLAFRIKEALRRLRERREAKLVRASGFFDDRFYSAQHVTMLGHALGRGVDPARHFVRHGHRLGLSPGPRFDAAAYLRNYPDVVANDENALVHYLTRGRFEGRAIDPVAHDARLVAWTHAAALAECPPSAADIPAMLSEIALPLHRDPAVSIIIPCFNKIEYTLSCLASIARHPPRTAFEVIVADDGSDAEEVAPLLEIANIKVLRADENVGFLRNCNRAADTARGRYLYFLNNDVSVHEGWLDALVDVFESARPGERVGVVGSKLLFADGSLQEAGGIVWRDGTGWNFGRNGSPDAPEFNYLREVDYCSGASIMVARALWDRVGGIDERFAPAYYEDTDLAFAARRAGYKVYYCPRSVVTHVEGVSSGTDLTGGVKRHQAANHPKFVEKWHRELASQLPPGESPFLARERAHLSNVIVMVDHHVPNFDTNAGDLAVWEYLLLLRDTGFKVKFFPNNGYLTPDYSARLQAAGIEVIAYAQPENVFDRWVRDHGHHVAWFWLARPEVAVDYIASIRRHTSARIAYFTHDLHFMRRAQELKIDWRQARDNPELREMYDTELSVLREADTVLSVSDDETAIIGDLLPDCDVRTVPLRLYDDADLAAPPRPFADRNGLLFLGGFGHPPNLDAMKWFVAEILPLIRRQRPDITLTIAGSKAPPEILRLKEVDGVDVLGFVEDLRPVFDAARFFVCPLRIGAGMKGKIVTSLGYGLPVITTSIGNQGLEMDRQVGVPVCDTAREFADAVLALYDNAPAWAEFSERSRALAARKFSRAGAASLLREVFGVGVAHCHVCGTAPTYIPPDPQGNLREEVVCRACGTPYRTNHLAACLLKELGDPAPASLAAAGDRLADLAIYEISGAGSLNRLLSECPRHVQAAYFDDIGPGGVGPRGIRCEDVERLTFADGSFDIVISEDVFEHVADPTRGFAEIFRVLKPGGSHIFTVPYYRDRDTTVTRATRTTNGIVHHESPEFHGDPFRAEGMLVYTDFGRDLADRLREIGFETEISAIHDPRFANSWNEVFVARKPKTDPPR